jgi:hypothetical protein
VKLRTTMLFAMLCITCTSCTAFRPIEGSSDEIQGRVLSGELLAVGERVRLVTSDGRQHRFRIVDVDPVQDVVSGRNDRVRISQITDLARREVSWLRTGALIGALGVLGLVGLFGIECEDECNEFGGLMCC